MPMKYSYRISRRMPLWLRILCQSPGIEWGYMGLKTVYTHESPHMISRYMSLRLGKSCQNLDAEWGYTELKSGGF